MSFIIQEDSLQHDPVGRGLEQLSYLLRSAKCHSLPFWTSVDRLYTFSHCESASVHLRSADCIGVVSWDTTPAKVASYRHSAPL